MPTSGTLGQTILTNQELLDHAFREVGIVEQEVTGEHIEVALRLLWLTTRQLSNKGIKLWNVEQIIIPIYFREQDAPMPIGTIDALDVNLRTLTTITGNATASEGEADNAFDQNLDTVLVQTMPGGQVTLEITGVSTTELVLDSAGSPEAAVQTFGILSNVTDTWSYEWQSSSDGVNFETLLAVNNQAVVEDEWIWVDIQGVEPAQFYRLQAICDTVLNVVEIAFQDVPQEIPFYQLNRTDYSNLPDKFLTGRPTQFWFDRQRTQPVITMWPSPDREFTFAQLVCYIQREIQDVGTLQQELEVPDRWYMAIILMLAKRLVRRNQRSRQKPNPRY